MHDQTSQSALPTQALATLAPPFLVTTESVTAGPSQKEIALLSRTAHDQVGLRIARCIAWCVRRTVRVVGAPREGCVIWLHNVRCLPEPARSEQPATHVRPRPVRRGGIEHLTVPVRFTPARGDQIKAKARIVAKPISIVTNPPVTTRQQDLETTGVLNPADRRYRGQSDARISCIPLRFPGTPATSGREAVRGISAGSAHLPCARQRTRAAPHWGAAIPRPRWVSKSAVHSGPFTERARPATRRGWEAERLGSGGGYDSSAQGCPAFTSASKGPAPRSSSAFSQRSRSKDRGLLEAVQPPERELTNCIPLGTLHTDKACACDASTCVTALCKSNSDCGLIGYPWTMQGA